MTRQCGETLLRCILSLVVTHSLLLPTLLLTGSNNMLNLALVCHNL
nr:MAG TPA: hypothetical protein [Caudoviricetes sp.]